MSLPEYRRPDMARAAGSMSHEHVVGDAVSSNVEGAAVLAGYAEGEPTPGFFLEPVEVRHARHAALAAAAQAQHEAWVQAGSRPLIVKRPL